MLVETFAALPFYSCAVSNDLAAFIISVIMVAPLPLAPAGLALEGVARLSVGVRVYVLRPVDTMTHHHISHIFVAIDAAIIKSNDKVQRDIID